MDEPSKVQAIKSIVKGSVKESVGKVIKNTDLETEGLKEKLDAERKFKSVEEANVLSTSTGQAAYYNNWDTEGTTEETEHKINDKATSAKDRVKIMFRNAKQGVKRIFSPKSKNNQNIPDLVELGGEQIQTNAGKSENKLADCTPYMDILTVNMAKPGISDKKSDKVGEIDKSIKYTEDNVMVKNSKKDEIAESKWYSIQETSTSKYKDYEGDAEESDEKNKNTEFTEDINYENKEVNVVNKGSFDYLEASKSWYHDNYLDHKGKTLVLEDSLFNNIRHFNPDIYEHKGKKYNW